MTCPLCNDTGYKDHASMLCLDPCVHGEGDRPRRVQLRRTKGWRMPENTVKVDRTNKVFGNPFRIGDNPSHFSTALPSHCDTLEQAVACFRYYADVLLELANREPTA